MRDKIKRNFVCVKIIKIKNIPKKEREATKVEVDLLKRLHHPNIVRYIDSFLSRNNESLCICMEYCDGVGDIPFTPILNYIPPPSANMYMSINTPVLHTPGRFSIPNQGCQAQPLLRK